MKRVLKCSALTTMSMRSLQRFDHLIGSAAGVVVGGQVPGGFRALEGLVEHLGVVVGHHGQQRGLRAGGNAIVFVDDLDAHAQPFAPGDADLVEALGADQVGGDRSAQQVGDGHLRLSFLDRALHFAQRIAGRARP